MSSLPYTTTLQQHILQLYITEFFLKAAPIKQMTDVIKFAKLILNAFVHGLEESPPRKSLLSSRFAGSALSDNCQGQFWRPTEFERS